MSKRKRTPRVLSPMQVLRREQGVDENGNAANSAAADTAALDYEMAALRLFINVWSVPSVDRECDISMVRWRVFEVNDIRVLFGYSVTNAWGRRSSAIVSTNARGRQVMTASGRSYQLDGPPGWDADAEHLLTMSRLVAEYRDVTEAFCKEHGIVIEQ